MTPSFDENQGWKGLVQHECKQTTSMNIEHRVTPEDHGKKETTDEYVT